MPDTSALQQHYDYWDDYITRWLACGRSCCTYLPEPWWGWTPASDRPLYSVIINLNPGKGGTSQTRNEIRSILKDKTYSEAMHSDTFLKKLHKTQQWHNSRRAKPILSKIREFNIKEDDYIFHHLSIELSPLHSASSQDVEGYVEVNHDDVIAHTIRFAADASMNVVEPMRGIVIVRCSAHRFINMFNECKAKSCDYDRNIGESPYWCRFDAPGFEDVNFVCVWGARNNLPKNNIEEIISTINKNLKV